MIGPPPPPGTVFQFSYLWAGEFDRGHFEGQKDRPALAIALALTDENGVMTVMALAITHTPPLDAGDAIELPRDVKWRLGLDEERSWIVTREANAFRWPGPDIRFIPRREPPTPIYGRIPGDLLQRVAQQYLLHRRNRTARLVHRDE
ncbi:MAG: hypothetical protein WDM81_12350 [Rhizomicrobium sp.]